MQRRNSELQHFSIETQGGCLCEPEGIVAENLEKPLRRGPGSYMALAESEESGVAAEGEGGIQAKGPTGFKLSRASMKLLLGNNR